MSSASYGGNTLSLAFAADTDKFLRVAINSSGQAAIAGTSAKCDGVNWMDDRDISVNAVGAVRLRSAGTTIMIASKAIAVGDPVYAAASGKVTDASGTPEEGVALTAAGADGEQIEVLLR